MDILQGGATAATNALQIGAVFNTSLPTLTTGQAGALQADSNARLLISPSTLTIGQASTTSGQSGSLVFGAVTTGAPSYTTAQSDPLSLDTTGNLRVIDSLIGGCAGQTVANTLTKPINSAGASTALTLVAGVSAKKVYVCSIDIGTAAANNIALVEGTTTTTACDTGTAGVAGGATAATGWNFAANQGETKGNGTGIVFKTATAANALCLLFSAATQVSGSITYAQF
jgi:hypothetical protein